jgi:hypothetical protein
MQALGEGILTLKPVEGNLIRDTEVFGQMSPYITMSFNGKKYKSKVHDSGGKKPAWTDEFVIEVSDPSEEIIIRVWDQDLTTSDAVGFTKLKMSSLIINCGVEDWFDIFFENNKAGSIKLVSKFEPKGGNEWDNMQEQLANQESVLKKQSEEAQVAIEQMAVHQQQLQSQLQGQSQAMQQKEQQLQQALGNQQQKDQQTAGQLAQQQQQLAQLQAEKAQMEQ